MGVKCFDGVEGVKGDQWVKKFRGEEGKRGQGGPRIRAKWVRGSRGQMARRKLGGCRGQGAGWLYGYIAI